MEVAMKQQMASFMLAAILASIATVPQASAKTAKECTAEWRADKAGMQARGTTEKAYVDQCKESSAPAATAPPATPSAAAPKAATGSSTKTTKDCISEWRADKAGMRARGTTQKAYVDQCKGGSEPTAAAPPVAPKPSIAAPGPAPVTPAPTAPPPPRQKTSASTEPAAKSGEFADEGQAKSHCPGDTIVWANLTSKVYHFSGGKSYGNTKRGAYMCEKEAMPAQFRASKKEKHP